MSEKVKYCYKLGFKVDKKTNLVITDPWYLEEYEPMLEISNGWDGLYNVVNEEDGEVLGNVAVDSATIGIFNKDDIEVSKLDRLVSPHYGKLYTEISSFEGNIALLEDKDEMIMLVFLGKSDEKDIEYTLAF